MKLPTHDRIRIYAVLAIYLGIFLIMAPVGASGEDTDPGHETPSEPAPEEEEESLRDLLPGFADGASQDDEAAGEADGGFPLNNFMLIMLFVCLLAGITAGHMWSQKKKREQEEAWDTAPVRQGRRLSSATAPSPLPTTERVPEYHRVQHAPVQPYTNPQSQYQQPTVSPYNQGPSAYEFRGARKRRAPNYNTGGQQTVKPMRVVWDS